jgi:HTH-type transcriptional regulator/antitoxin HigA
MDIRPIKTEADYQAALAEIEALFDAEPNAASGDRLEVLVTLVEAHEEAHFALPAPDPVEAVNYFLESRGLTRKDLEPYIGSRARVSEVLSRKRPLTLRMIQRLHHDLGIPAEVLLAPYSARTAKARKQPTPGKRKQPAAERPTRHAQA